MTSDSHTLQREIEKQNQLQILARQTAQAKDRYQKSLMMTYGLAPWKHLISIAKHNEHRASNHSNQVLMTKCFVPWQQTVKETIQEKEKEADSLYRDLLLKRHFSVWQEVGGLYMSVCLSVKGILFNRTKYVQMEAKSSTTQCPHQSN